MKYNNHAVSQLDFRVYGRATTVETAKLKQAAARSLIRFILLTQ
jgi:hypothetical protein